MWTCGSISYQGKDGIYLGANQSRSQSEEWQLEEADRIQYWFSVCRTRKKPRPYVAATRSKGARNNTNCIFKFPHKQLLRGAFNHAEEATCGVHIDEHTSIYHLPRHYVEQASSYTEAGKNTFWTDETSQSVAQSHARPYSTRSFYSNSSSCVQRAQYTCIFVHICIPTQ